MKKQEVMKLKEADMEKKLDECKKELFSLKSASLAGEDSLKKKARLKSVKKTIARLKTRINNK